MRLCHFPGAVQVSVEFADKECVCLLSFTLDPWAVARDSCKFWYMSNIIAIICHISYEVYFNIVFFFQVLCFPFSLRTGNDIPQKSPM